MNDKQLDILLRQTLRPREVPPQIDLTAKRKPSRFRASGVLAACACLAVCVTAFFAVQPTFGFPTGATESAAVTEDAAEATVTFSVSDGIAAGLATVQEAEPQEPQSGAGDISDTCRYPTKLDAAVEGWMAVNAPAAAYEVLADTEDYRSIRTVSEEGEPLYLVMDKRTMEPVSLEQLLERGDFAVEEEQVTMLYVDRNQDLILVQEDGEVNLGPIE